MSDDVLVKVEGVSKKFCRSLKRSLWYGVQDVSAEMFGRKGQHDELRKNEFWAVNDVSFELRRGECLGLIGPNGAGKSTLLKMLNGLVKPDQGRITMRGRVGALIELGAGFNPILTARENIYVNGSVLGFTKKEIDRKFDAIVDFAEIEEFIDTPVQNFSSGMKVRLGFAVAAQMEPDVLLIDEVLAVGDVGFRAKCFNRIAQHQDDCVVLFVSHNMPQIGRICDGVMTLDRGHAKHYEQVWEGIRNYSELASSPESILCQDSVAILTYRLLDQTDTETSVFDYGDRIVIEFDVEFATALEYLVFNLHFVDPAEQYVYQANSRNDGFVMSAPTAGRYRIKVETPPLKLNPGRYSCSFVIRDRKERNFIAWAHAILPFEIRGRYAGISPYQDRVTWSLNIRLPEKRSIT